MNERLDGKTNITFEFRTVEKEHKRKNSTVHMYGTIYMYGTVYVTVHDTVHIDGSMMWH